MAIGYMNIFKSEGDSEDRRLDLRMSPKRLSHFRWHSLKYSLSFWSVTLNTPYRFVNLHTILGLAKK